MTKDLSSMNFLKIGAISQKTKIILIASGFLVAGAAPVIYVISKEVPQVIVEGSVADIIGDVESSIPAKLIEDEDNDSFVMQEGFFKSSNDSEISENENVEVEPDYYPPASESYFPLNKNNGDKKNIHKISLNKDNPIIEVANVQKRDDGNVVNNASLQTFQTKSKITSGSRAEVKYINHDEGKKVDDIAELLADKEYPSTIASKPHDLSRILTTDSFIPAVMYTAINSEIPSKTVLAIVESDISGFHGRNILIPKGSKIEGVYEKLESKHARRMQITWFKITRPDGVIIKLDGESADIQGAGGLGGYLDQRLKDRYGGAILLSTINALAQISVKQNDIRQLAAVESFGREFGTLTTQIIRENINAMPIIMIKQGTRFNIRPYQNIYFPKSQNQSVKALFIEE